MVTLFTFDSVIQRLYLEYASTLPAVPINNNSNTKSNIFDPSNAARLPDD